MSSKGEHIFKHMAEEYIEFQGEKLKRERQELERDGIPELHSLDIKVKKAMSGKRKVIISIAGLAAACLLLLIAIPALRITGGYSGAAGSSIDAESELSTATVQSASESQIMGAQQHSDSEEKDSVAGEIDSYQLQMAPNMDFELPDQYAVTGFTQEEGKAIYYLEHDAAGEIVVEIEQGGQLKNENFEVVSINGIDVYTLFTGEEQLLTFKKNDLLYTLCCSQDADSLMSLAGSILQQ